MIKGFTTPKEGDKDTWPPEGWMGTLKLEYFNGEIEYTNGLHLRNLKLIMQRFGKIYKSVQWLDETPCTEQVRELLEKYKQALDVKFSWGSPVPDAAIEEAIQSDPLIQTVEKLLK